MRQRILQKLSFMNLTFRMLRHTSSEVTVTLTTTTFKTRRPIPSNEVRTMEIAKSAGKI